MPAITSAQHPTKIQIWGMFICCAMLRRHMTSQKTTVRDRDEYYQINILANKWLEVFNRKAQEGSVSNRVLMPDSSQTVFMRGGAPPQNPSKNEK